MITSQFIQIKIIMNFKIEKIDFNGDAEINNLIDKKLKKYSKKKK